MSSKFEQCISNGSYDTVSAGEYCTLEVAKELGVADSEKYFSADSGFDDVMTYNEKKDDNENRTQQLCSYSSKAPLAYKSCALEHGLGFARKMSEPSKCMTFSCPPNFENTGISCKKPLEDFTISKLSRCDERWYDWFMTPNYHLGNKYLNPKPGQCYKPCPDFHVPGYAIDPVDDTSAGINVKEQLDRCVARNDYMSGKYEVGSDYCPLAWIHRLTSFPSSVRTEYLQKLQDFKDKKRDGVMNDYYTKLRDNANIEADAIAKEANSLIENLTNPTDAQTQACRTLNTPERLNKAYEVCSSLVEDDTWYGDKLEQEFDDNEVKRVAKTKMLKQACNALFCSATDNANEEIGKPQICSKMVGEVEVPPDEEEKDRPAPLVDAGKAYFNRSLTVAFSIILTGIFGMMFILFLIYFLWPKILVPIGRFIYNLFARYKMKENKIENIISDLS